MTKSEERELLELTRQNNKILRAMLRFVQHDDANDFLTNVAANIIGNRLDQYNYAKRPY